MAQITITVDDRVYKVMKACSVKQGEASISAVVRKLVTCYAKGIIYFRGPIPAIRSFAQSEYELEVYGPGETSTGADVTAEETINPLPTTMASGEPWRPTSEADWDEVKRVSEAERAAYDKAIKDLITSPEYKDLGRQLLATEPKEGQEPSAEHLKVLEKIKCPTHMDQVSTVDCWWNTITETWERPTDTKVKIRRAR
jgi:hypothetical protein